MVPEGLVLLTSISFGLAAVVARPPPGARAGAARGRGTGAGRCRLPRQDRARSPRGSSSSSGSRSSTRTPTPTSVTAALGAMSHDEGGNATQDAIADAFPAPRAGTRDGRVPFSSARKWSAASFERTRHLGARRAGDGAGSTRRIRRATRPTSSPRPAAGCCCWPAPTSLAGDELPPGLVAVALVLLEEKVRPDAAETLALLPRAGRDAEGHLRRQPAHGRRGGPPGRAARRGGSGRRARASRGHRRARRGARGPRGVRAGHAAAEARRWSRRCSRAATSSR